MTSYTHRVLSISVFAMDPTVHQRFRESGDVRLIYSGIGRALQNRSFYTMHSNRKKASGELALCDLCTLMVRRPVVLPSCRLMGLRESASMRQRIQVRTRLNRVKNGCSHRHHTQAGASPPATRGTEMSRRRVQCSQP
jgi:hypothetical protein